MKVYKLFFFVNIVIIIIESASIALHLNSLGWFLFMMLGIGVEIISVISKKDKED